MRFNVWVWCAGLVLAAGVSVDAGLADAQSGAGSSAMPFADLAQIKKFVSLEVQTQGTAEKLKLRSSELTDTMRLAFLKSFPGIALEISGGPSAEGMERMREVGFFTCEVWTVGEAYTVAYHMDCNAGSYLMPRAPGTLWNRSILGYGPKDDIFDTIYKDLLSMIDQFAVTFYKVRGETSP